MMRWIRLRGRFSRRTPQPRRRRPALGNAMRRTAKQFLGDPQRALNRVHPCGCVNVSRCSVCCACAAGSLKAMIGAGKRDAMCWTRRKMRGPGSDAIGARIAGSFMSLIGGFPNPDCISLLVHRWGHKDGRDGKTWTGGATRLWGDSSSCWCGNMQRHLRGSIDNAGKEACG